MQPTFEPRMRLKGSAKMDIAKKSVVNFLTTL